MGMRHIVGQGDSLWDLAGRYLGNNELWPSIHDYHNRFVRRNGGVGRGLLFIENPDLIFIGQAVMVPGRKEERPPKPDPVKRTRRTKRAVPLDAEATYILHPDSVAPTDVTLYQPLKSAVRYGPFVTPDFTMTSELSGSITLKNMSPLRYRANWELVLSDERNDLSYALRSQGHDAAFLELIAGMEMDFDTVNRTATIKPSLAAKAGLGPYTLRLEMVSPGRLSWTLKLDTITGEIEAHRRRFRFSADVAIKIDVTLHPRGKPDEPAPNPLRESNPQRVPATEKNRPRFLPTKTEWVIGGTFVVGVVIAAAVSPLLASAGVAATAGTAVFAVSTGTLDILRRKRTPRRHVIDTNDPKLRS